MSKILLAGCRVPCTCLKKKSQINFGFLVDLHCVVEIILKEDLDSRVKLFNSSIFQSFITPNILVKFSAISVIIIDDKSWTTDANDHHFYPFPNSIKQNLCMVSYIIKKCNSSSATYLLCFKWVCHKTNASLYLNHVCFIFIQDKYHMRFVLYLSSLMKGQML